MQNLLRSNSRRYTTPEIRGEITPYVTSFTIFSIVGKNNELLSDRTSIVLLFAKRIFESIRPAGDERPVRGSLTNRLVGAPPARNSRPLGSSSSLVEKVTEGKVEEDEVEEEAVEYHRGNSFVSFCPPTQRRATIAVVARRGCSALAIIDFYNFPCPPFSKLPIPLLTHASPQRRSIPTISLFLSFGLYSYENSSGYLRRLRQIFLFWECHHNLFIFNYKYQLNNYKYCVIKISYTSDRYNRIEFSDCCDKLEICSCHEGLMKFTI